ncbi:hypothetical protein D3C76_668090 [compost metagenome]
MTGQGGALAGHGRVQRLERRSIGLVRHLCQRAGCGCSRISRHLIADGHPGTAVPALGRVGCAGGIDPQVLGLAVGNRRRSRLIQHLALAAGQTGRCLRRLLSSGYVAVGGLQAVIELGDAAALARQRIAVVADGRAERLQCRSVGLAGQLRQCRLSGRRGVGGYLVRHSHPGSAVPPFWGVGVAGRVDPQVLRKTISSGRRSRLHQHLPFATRQRGRVLGGLLGGGDVLVGGGQAAAQRGDSRGVRLVATDPRGTLIHDRSHRGRRRDLADGNPVDLEHIAGRRAEPQVEPGDRAVRPVAATIGQL